MTAIYKMTKDEWKTFKNRNIKLIYNYINTNVSLKKAFLKRFPLFKIFFFKKLINLIEILRFILTKKISIPTMDFNITTRCTLKCKDCGSLMPLYTKEQQFDENFECFKKHLDNLLKNINYIYQFKLIGGEPFLNKDLYRMIEYACSKKQIILIEIVTNGTIIPNQDILNLLKKNNHKVSVYVSNYTNNKNIKILKYDKLIEILKENKITYNTNDLDSFIWLERGEIYARNKSKKDLIQEFENCWQKNCVSFFEGRFYVCTRAYYIEKVLNPDINNGECIDFNLSQNTLKNDLIKFYSRNSFSACDYCHNDYKKQTTPAIQIGE